MDQDLPTPTPSPPQEFLQAILDSLPQHIAVLDSAGTITLVNRAWRRFASENAGDGHSSDYLAYLGSNYLNVCRAVTGPEAEQAARVVRSISEVLQGSLPDFSLEYPCHSPTEQRWFILNVTPLEGGDIGAVVSHLDITSRVLQEQEIERLARIDPLTGLANRRFFFEQSAPILASSRRHGRDLCLMFIDLDDFKEINDTLGHSAGDAVLSEVAARLKNQARASDLVARLGGDEFMVLLEAPVRNVAQIVATRYQVALRAPIAVAGTVIHPTTSIGIAAYTTDVENIEDLIGRADGAMYRAKRLDSGIYMHSAESFTD